MENAASFPVRIYYEDTDSGGIVYYANYLKFAERARTELLRSAGISQKLLHEELGLGFVVRKAAMELFAPAKLDDLLTITSRLEEMGGASFTLKQAIYREDTLLAEVQVKIACVKLDTMKPARIPAVVRKIYK